MTRFLLLCLCACALFLSSCAVTVTPATVRAEARPAAVVMAQGKRVATDRDLCKQGGWRTLVRRDGGSFRNQGACESYARTGR
jgi:hypothetical protein